MICSLDFMLWNYNCYNEMFKSLHPPWTMPTNYRADRATNIEFCWHMVSNEFNIIYYKHYGLRYDYLNLNIL